MHLLGVSLAWAPFLLVLRVQFIDPSLLFSPAFIFAVILKLIDQRVKLNPDAERYYLLTDVDKILETVLMLKRALSRRSSNMIGDHHHD